MLLCAFCCCCFCFAQFSQNITRLVPIMCYAFRDSAHLESSDHFCWCVCPLFILFLWIPSTWEFWSFPVGVCAHCSFFIFFIFSLVDSIHMEVLIISCWCVYPVFTLHLWIPATLGVMITSCNFLSALGEFKSCWQFWLLLGHFLMYYFCFGKFSPIFLGVLIMPHAFPFVGVFCSPSSQAWSLQSLH